MSVINASDVYLKISSDGGASFSKLLFATEANLSTSQGLRDITTKFSNGNTMRAEGKREWSLSGSGFVAFTVDFDTSDLNDLLVGRVLTYVELTAVAGDTVNLVGETYLDARSEEGGTEDNQTYSLSLAGGRYFGYGYAGYTAERVKYHGGTPEATACVDAAITALMQISIS